MKRSAPRNSLPDGNPREQRRIALRLQQLEAIADLGNAGLACRLQAGDRQGARGRHRRRRVLADSRQRRGAHRGGPGPARRRRVDGVLRAGATRRAGQRRRASLSGHSYENIEPDRPRARTRRSVCAARGRHSACASHVGTRPAARRTLDDAIAAFNRTNDLENAYYAAEKIPAALTGITCTTSTCSRPRTSTRGRCAGRGAPARSGGREADHRYQEYNQKSLAVFLLGGSAGVKRWRRRRP